jgi:Uncharacterized alpha/beta hydrolase domain (DUF2235)
MTDVIAPRVRAVENMVARAQAVTKQGNTQGACLTCEAKLWMTFFFDGTGNHRDLHFPAKHSNVAALFDAHLDTRSVGIAAFYYEGIGMPFEFKDRYTSKTVATRGAPHKVETVGHKEDESGWNKAFGTEIDKRLEKAMFDFQVFVEDWRRRRRVDEINVAAFGFSRGSATARAFMHWMRAHSKISQSGSKLSYDGIPVNVKFLGVFDTVESIGTAGDNDQPVLIKTSVPAFVEKSFHVIAAHELRHAFPITVLGTERYKQVVFPGAHADVGGGYTDREQGRSNALPRIGLLQMLDEARGAGLKMQSIGEMLEDEDAWIARLKFSFGVEQPTRDAFVSYMEHVETQAGPIEAVFRSHCDLYRAWIDAGLAMEDVQQNLSAARTNGSQSPRVDEAVVQQRLLSSLARTPSGRGEAISGGPQRGAVAPEVERFFENYVHDSFQHFSLSGGTMQMDLTLADYYKLRDVKSPKA